MALRIALVDKARTLSRVSTGVKVAGTSQMATVEGPWFRVRLTLPPQPDTADPAGGRTRVEKRPTLLVDRRDENGDPVVLNTEMRLEVVSRELGSATYLLDADPEPLRKRHTVIGWEVPLRRIEDHELSAQAVA